MPWEKKKKTEKVYPIRDCTWGISTPVHPPAFTFESLQKLIKGLEKSKHYRTIVFDTVSPEIRDRV